MEEKISIVIKNEETKYEFSASKNNCGTILNEIANLIMKLEKNVQIDVERLS